MAVIRKGKKVAENNSTRAEAAKEVHNPKLSETNKVKKEMDIKPTTKFETNNVEKQPKKCYESQLINNLQLIESD